MSSQPAPLLPPGRVLLTLVALMTSTACFIADWNESHIYNHTWPGHAKFHNGQTMSMGLLLGVAALYYIYRAPLGERNSRRTNKPTAAAASKAANEKPSPAAPGNEEEALLLARLRAASAHRDLATAVLLNSLYWITQLSAHFYPQVTAFDPVPGSARFGEHVHQDPHLQKKLDLSMFVVTGIGWWFEARRIERGQF